MAAKTSVPPLGGAHRDGKLSECPMCGQPLLDHDAVKRVERVQHEMEQKVDSAIQVRAAQLAKQIATREREAADKKIAKLTEQVESQKSAVTDLKAEHRETLANQKKAHNAEVRKLRTAIRAEVVTEAEREATAKVQRELRQRDKLISGLRDQNEVQQRRIEHLTADERGEMNEEDLVARLRVAFPDDRIDRVGRGRAGSDILHEIRYAVGERTEVAGLVVYECKDTLQWNNAFVAQAKKARVTHRTPHVVVVSRAFPRTEKVLCVREDVPIVAPARLVDLANVMRGMVIELHRAGLTGEDHAAKTQDLYEYLSGNEFRQAFDTLLDASDELNDLLSKERRAHESTWEKRQHIYNELGGRAAAIDGRLRTIIERSSDKKGKVVALARNSEAS